MGTKSEVGVLNRLYRTAKAGEWGFNTVAGVVRNRGLKVLLKTFAQQRRQMADELAAEIERLGGDVTERRSFPAMVHRGRVALVGTMIIKEGRTTRAMLKEAALGEDAAMRRYRRALDADLSAETRALLNDHLRQIEETAATVTELRSQNGKRMLVHLFPSQQHAAEAVDTLEADGVAVERVAYEEPESVVKAYQGETAVVSEVVLSGGVGGGLWGGLLGTFAGAGLVIGAGISAMAAPNPYGLWALIILISLFSGIVVGAVMGLFIGVGYAEEDAYVYGSSLNGRDVLVTLYVDTQVAEAVATRLYRMSVKSQAQAEADLQLADGTSLQVA